MSWNGTHIYHLKSLIDILSEEHFDKVSLLNQLSTSKKIESDKLYQIISDLIILEQTIEKLDSSLMILSRK